MIKKPLVSIIIPTQNRASLLKRAIQSVLNQTFQDFEIIIVDDNSKDNTKEIIRLFKDKRIKYIYKSRLPHNPASTRNEGIIKAKGKYIAFLDDDDEWFSQKLELQLKEFEKDKDIGLVYTKCIVLKNKKVDKISGIKRISTPSVIVKKEIINKIGLFDENLDCAEDRDMWLRVSKECKLKFINKILTKVHLHNQISTNLKKKIKSEEYFIKKYFIEKLKDKTIYKNYFNLGSLYIKYGNFKKAKKCFLRSLDLKENLSSLRIISYILFISLFPKTLRRILTRNI